MAKGTSSGNSLKRISHDIHQFVLSWTSNATNNYPRAASVEWPAPYRIAILKGEAILRLRFFDSVIAGLTISLSDEQALIAWHTLVCHSSVLKEFVQRVEIVKALKREAVIPQHAAQETLNLYYILCFAIAEQEPSLLPTAIDSLMLYQWKQQFANTVSVVARKPSKEALEDRVLIAIRKHNNAAAELKESFSQNADVVEFSLLIRAAQKEPWEVLVQLSRPRLSTARQAAYEEALRLLAR